MDDENKNTHSPDACSKAPRDQIANPLTATRDRLRNRIRSLHDDLARIEMAIAEQEQSRPIREIMMRELASSP